jgi:hypothetical protein
MERAGSGGGAEVRKAFSSQGPQRSVPRLAPLGPLPVAATAMTAGEAKRLLQRHRGRGGIIGLDRSREQLGASGGQRVPRGEFGQHFGQCQCRGKRPQGCHNRHVEAAATSSAQAAAS